MNSSPDKLIIDAEGISVVHYDARRRRLLHVLKDIDFTVKAGECHFIVGESGSGKSSLLNLFSDAHGYRPGIIRGRLAIAGMEIEKGSSYWEQQNSGAVRQVLAASRIGQYRSRIHRERQYDHLFKSGGMAFIFQQNKNSLNPNLLVGDIWRDCGIDTESEDFTRLLSRTNLDTVKEDASGLLNARAVHFSGGQKMRINALRALASKAELILADEPTTGLDVGNRDAMIELFRRLVIESRARSKAAVVVTHDLQSVQGIIDGGGDSGADGRIFVHVMFGGRIVERLQGRDWKDRCRHPYTRDYIDWTDTPLGSDTGVLDYYQPVTPELSVKGCQYRVRCSRYAGLGSEDGRLRCEQELPQLEKEKQELPQLDSAERGGAAACHFADTLLPGCRPAGSPPLEETRQPVSGAGIGVTAGSADEKIAEGSVIGEKNRQPDPHLSADGVVFSRPGVKNFPLRVGTDNHPFIVNPGETVLLTGESGCGKTTLLQLLSGLLQPDSGHGRIIIHQEKQELDSWDISHEVHRSRSRLQAVQYVFQESGMAYNPAFSVLETAAEPYRRIHRLSRDEAEYHAWNLLKAVGIHTLKTAMKTCYLSGGELKRLLLARAFAAVGYPLSSTRSLLLIDELTTGYDIIHEHLVIDVLASLRDSFPLTVVLATHNQRLKNSYREKGARIFSFCADEEGTQVVEEKG